MRFGIGPFSAEQAGELSWMEAYETIGEAARQAEASGFDSVWVSERHFAPDGHCSQAFVAAANLAAKTESIKIGVSAVTGLTHPLYIAEDAAVLDNLSGGRAIISPVNAVSHERAAYGLSEMEYNERFRESIEVLLTAWRPKPFRFDGKFWKIPADLPEHATSPSGVVMFQPQPAQFELPMWIGGSWDFGRQVAAELGLPIVVSEFTGNENLSGLWADYDAVAVPAMRRPKVLIRDVYVTTGENPLAEIKEMVSYQSQRYSDWGVWSGNADEADAPTKTPLIAGNPDEVIEQIAALDETNGLDHLICRMHFPGMPLHQLLSSMDLFSREVIPEYRMSDLPKQIRTGV